MKKIFFSGLLVVFVSSCAAQFSSPQESIHSSASAYCSLLHVPSRPPLPIQPKPYLGIYLATKKIEYSQPACSDSIFVQVDGIIDGTAAAEAGLKEGDVILSFNNNPTCKEEKNVLASFKKMVEQQTIGSIVEMDILRGDKKLSVTAQLKERPIRYQPEAEHRRIGECPANPSNLETVLRAQGSLDQMNKVFDGLYEKSNTVHNPRLAYEEKFHPLQLKEVTYSMRHPLAAGEVARELSQRLTTPLDEPNRQMIEIIQRAASLLDIDLSPSDGSTEVSFTSLLQIMEETKDRVEEALSNLPAEERSLLWQKALNPWDDSQWNTILEISMKVDRAALFNAFSPLLSFLTQNNLSLLKEDLVRRFGQNKGPILYNVTTPVGKVLVGGAGPNVYTEDAALILDLGGDDLYLNNSGGTRPGMPVALVVDFEGNDHYMTKENFSQGAGVFGGGFLFDLSGEDTFISLDGSQGVGLWGIGFLYHGNGNSIYEARNFSQGVGQMGIGIISNRKGNNRYACLYGGQGLGIFGGAGILIDEAGNDYYHLGGLVPDFRDPLKSAVSMGQGFGQGIRPEKGKHGVPGGIGILIDKEGNDTYIADYFAQGSSYYYSIGILNDIAGDDQYIVGRYAQGAGIHSSVGVFIDQSGDDFYYASSGVAQGLGHDFGVGYFEDDKGNDLYWGGTLVQGAATDGSLGIFIDLEGDNSNTCVKEGQGFAEGETGVGIMMYTKPNDDLPAGKYANRVSITMGIGKGK